MFQPPSQPPVFVLSGGSSAHKLDVAAKIIKLGGTVLTVSVANFTRLFSFNWSRFARFTFQHYRYITILVNFILTTLEEFS